MRPWLAFAALLVSPLAFADDLEVDLDGVDDAENVVYQRETHIDFGTVDVRSSVDGPSGQLVVETPRKGFNPMIVLRESFDAEMRDSLDAVN